MLGVSHEIYDTLSCQDDRVTEMNEMAAEINECIIEMEAQCVGDSVMELFSLPRLTEKAESMGFTAGSALDLVNGWDASSSDGVNEMWISIDKERPHLIGLSPPCRKLSILQNLTPAAKRKDMRRHLQQTKCARDLVALSVEVALHQLAQGRHFFFEAPPGAST